MEAPADRIPPVSKVLHTMGLGGRSLETILEMLAVARVTRLVDIRRYGSAGRTPHHASPVLHALLRERGIEVLDLGALLGGDRRGGFARYMQGAGFRRGLEKLEAFAADGPVMVLCAERDVDRCHRRFVATALEARGWKVAHHLSTLAERTARGQMRLVRKTG